MEDSNVRSVLSIYRIRLDVLTSWLEHNHGKQCQIEVKGIKAVIFAPVELQKSDIDHLKNLKAWNPPVKKT
ncbi:hypothetical protein CGCF413_v012417 [Colletotrichum fructicola]|nr:hypothetical protein CGCF413_v012417 [Colletotrichum fructicola]